MKKTPCYQERDEEKRLAYHEKIQNYQEEEIIYLDESGISGKMHRTHGRSPIGECVFGFLTGKRAPRTNIIGAWSRNIGLFATQLFENITVNKERFTNWLKTHLVPHLHTGKIIVMDNAPWHKGQDIRDIIEKTGAKLIFLPPYSPDLNPIEHAWANLKAKIKKIANEKLTIKQKITKIL